MLVHHWFYLILKQVYQGCVSLLNGYVKIYIITIVDHLICPRLIIQLLNTCYFQNLGVEKIVIDVAQGVGPVEEKLKEVSADEKERKFQKELSGKGFEMMIYKGEHFGDADFMLALQDDLHAF